MPQATSPSARLSTIQAHMDGGNPTVFHADNVPQAPEDPLFGLMAAYRKDDFEKKVDLGIGAYRDNNAKPWVLPVVKQVFSGAVITWKLLRLLTRSSGRRNTTKRSKLKP
jgi:aspartate aminotransferase